MIKISLNDQVRKCDHCGAKNIKRTYCILHNNQRLFIGRICIERLTEVNTSGNPHNAIKRLQSYLNQLDEDELDSLVSSTD